MKLFPSRSISRRRFLVNTSAAAGSMLISSALHGQTAPSIQPCGPASRYTPLIKAAFVRRKEDYGILWPGAVFDGEAAQQKIQDTLSAAANGMGVFFDLRPEPIYSPEEADAWVNEIQARKPDGIMVLLLDRQQHAWPTVAKVADTGIRTVVYSPIGTSFTTNTLPLSNRTNLFISSTDDLAQPVYALKMLKAAAKLRETRTIVIKGEERKDSRVAHFGTRLRTIPAKTFLDEYRRTEINEEVKTIAKDYMRHATGMHGATQLDVEHGVKSFLVARNILQREDGDAITMDCLGALGKTEVSLPCIAWSKMLDSGIPAACEADIGAALTHALVQQLFDRPGFQQDPVPETVHNCLIGAHCTCPTKLNGFDRPAERYRLAHHHGNRDAVPIPHWQVGERMTCADILLRNNQPPQMIVSAGTVVDNVSVPPAGGCVVSVMVELDNVDDYLSYPGFHQLFFYGDYKEELRSYCKLNDMEPIVI